ncbi:hypothetical protein HYU93_01495 [Candidatus Daviesbacteria bacterium]|nr:hypothetical protein [Candidatus Daviesbacteria bacterium]
MFNWQVPNLEGGIVLLLIMWELFWKGIGLWRSAKKGALVWFIAILLINLFGLIPIFYLWRTKQLDEVLTDIKTFFSSKFKKK